MKALFRQLQNSPHRRLQHLSLLASLIDGDERDLILILRRLGAMSYSETHAAVEQIRYQLRPSDSASVRRLGQVAVSASGELQLACANELERIHNRASLPFLAQLLASPNSQLRVLAVGGLARFANNVPSGELLPAAGPWKYRTDETMRNTTMDEGFLQRDPSILSFWKEWWRVHRAELELRR